MLNAKSYTEYTKEVYSNLVKLRNNPTDTLIAKKQGMGYGTLLKIQFYAITTRNLKNSKGFWTYNLPGSG